MTEFQEEGQRREGETETGLITTNYSTQMSSGNTRLQFLNTWASNMRPPHAQPFIDSAAAAAANDDTTATAALSVLIATAAQLPPAPFTLQCTCRSTITPFCRAIACRLYYMPAH